MDIAAIVALGPVIPVLTIQRQADAIPLAQALIREGLRVLGITLRTGVALEALRAIASEVPDAVVGAGTVLNARQVDQARQAGARFVVSPGCTPGLTTAAEVTGLPFFPGVQTTSEAMMLAERGYSLLKLFPADTSGGPGWLKAVAAPLAGLRFCPTGRIRAETASSYLALPNVACVGGAWMAPREAVAASDWLGIERLAAAAARLKRF